MATFQPKIKRVEGTQPESNLSVHDRIKTGRTLMKEDRNDEALAEFETALKLDPNSLPAHLAIATIKFRRKEYAVAHDHMEDVLRLDPMHLRAQLRLSQIHLAEGHYDLALASAENAIRLDAKIDVPHLAAGNICLLTGDLPRARKFLIAALRLNPRSSRARLKMAKVLERGGEIEEALGHLNAAVRVDPENPEVFEDLGLLHLHRKDSARAREAFEQALQRNPKETSIAQMGLAEALIGLQEWERAEKILHGVAMDGRQGAKIHKLWGDIYHGRGMFKEAVEEYEAAKLLASKEAIDAQSLESEIVIDDYDDDNQWKARAAASKATTDEVLLKQRLDPPRRKNLDDYV